jgi:hypothetical protein
VGTTAPRLDVEAKGEIFRQEGGFGRVEGGESARTSGRDAAFS